MTTIMVDVRDVVGAGASGIVTIRANPARPGDTGYISGQLVPAEITDGVGTMTGVAPGPAELRIKTTDPHWLGRWQVIVPDQATVTFADLVDDQTVWPAPVVAAAQQARNESRAARDESRDYRDQARQAAEEMEGGVRPGGWLMDDMSAEVIAAMGGGVTIPAGGWPKTDLATAVRASLDLADTASQPGHTHSAAQITMGTLDVARLPTIPAAQLATTGAAEGWVVTRGPGGVAAWAEAESGGTPGAAISGSGLDPVASGAESTSSISLGWGSSAAYGGVSIGYEAKSVEFGVAVGRYTTANFRSSAALGANARATKANQIMLGDKYGIVTMLGKAELGDGSTQVTLSTRLEGGKVQFGITWPGSSTFVPIATQP